MTMRQWGAAITCDDSLLGFRKYESKDHIAVCNPPWGSRLVESADVIGRTDLSLDPNRWCEKHVCVRNALRSVPRVQFQLVSVVRLCFGFSRDNPEPPIAMSRLTRFKRPSASTNGTSAVVGLCPRAAACRRCRIPFFSQRSGKRGEVDDAGEDA
jgi:hypothetical protein